MINIRCVLNDAKCQCALSLIKKRKIFMFLKDISYVHRVCIENKSSQIVKYYNCSILLKSYIFSNHNSSL